jgi:hypothetical protein
LRFRWLRLVRNPIVLVFGSLYTHTLRHTAVGRTELSLAQVLSYTGHAGAFHAARWRPRALKKPVWVG